MVTVGRKNSHWKQTGPQESCVTRLYLQTKVEIVHKGKELEMNNN